MKIASIFCCAISSCARAMRALRSATLIGTTPSVIGLSAAIAGWRPASAWATASPVFGASFAQPANAIAPPPSAAVFTKSRRFMVYSSAT